MKYLIGALSDIGKKRRQNEDSILAEPILITNMPAAMVAVADGMGGTSGGEIASRLVIRALSEELVEQKVGALSNSDLDSALGRAFLHAKESLKAEIKNRRHLAEMGTTLTCLLIVEDKAVWAHVGDSRLYVFRDSVLTRLTRDHTVAQDLVDKGEIKQEEIPSHHARNVLTAWLPGDHTTPSTEIGSATAKAGDLYLVCSDGLYAMAADDQIAAVIKSWPIDSTQASIHILLGKLVGLANANGGADNISVAMIAVLKTAN